MFLIPNKLITLHIIFEVSFYPKKIKLINKAQAGNKKITHILSV